MTEKYLTEDDITVEMIDALETLRDFAEGKEISMSLPDAIKILDASTVFAVIDNAITDEEAQYERLMAGLRGIDLSDRYPKGDANGIIGRTLDEED